MLKMILLTELKKKEAKNIVRIHSNEEYFAALPDSSSNEKIRKENRERWERYMQQLREAERFTK